MINLSRHIEYLLLYHDSVVVPRLGTFKALYVPSKWIEEEEIFLPPYRALTFSHEIDETDTCFVDTLSANYQISTEEAYILTLEFTENIQQELSEYGNFELGSIGEFVQGETTERMNFIPCQAGVASPGLYGLDVIHAHPTSLKASPKNKQEKKKMSVKSDARNVTISINKHILRYAMAIAASIVLFFAISTPVSDTIITKQQATQSSLFIPANILTSSQEASTMQTVIKDGTNVSEKEIDPEDVSKETTGETMSQTVKTTTPTFSVVLCCGVSMQKAESYCQNLNERGIHAIVDNSGKVLRILIPNFKSKEDALAEVHSLRSMSKEFSNVWIMEKK